jgi:hypothetical protein
MRQYDCRDSVRLLRQIHASTPLVLNATFLARQRYTNKAVSSTTRIYIHDVETIYNVNAPVLVETIALFAGSSER